MTVCLLFRRIADSTTFIMLNELIGPQLNGNANLISGENYKGASCSQSYIQV